MRLVISQMAISKSICGNLNRRLKNRGMRIPSLRELGGMPPNVVEGPECCLGRDMCGFIMEIALEIGRGVQSKVGSYL
jgi:hypothetical protein